MATVNSYTSAKIDALVNSRAPSSHTHTLADVGFTPWTNFSARIWAINGSDCDLGTAGNGSWQFCRYMLMGPDTMIYQGQFTFGSSTTQTAGRYLGFSSPHPWDSGRQPGSATLIRSSAYNNQRGTQGWRMSGADPNHYVFVFPPGNDGGPFLTSDSWSPGDIIAFNMTVKIS